MENYLPVLGVALAFALTGTPVAKWLAARLGVMDQPNRRKVHKVPTPLLGGLAIYVAFLIALVAFWNTGGLIEVVGIVTGATYMAMVGFMDDSGRLSPKAKLIYGMPAAALVLVLAGVQATFLHAALLDILVTILWVMGITAAFNLLDNMDGLAAGVAAVACVFFLWFAVDNDQYLVGTLAAATLGAALGFLRYNFNPAQIFMGDGGALFLGFVMAAVGLKIRLTTQTETISWMVPILVLGVPILDTSLVTISRLRRGLNPASAAGKDHLSHRLVALGMSQRRAVMTIYLMGVGFGVLAIAMSRIRSELYAYGLAAAIVVAALVLIGALERVKYDAKAQERERPGAAGTI